MTGEPFLPARTANQYLAGSRTNIWPDIGSRFAPVKMVHRSCDFIHQISTMLFCDNKGAMTMTLHPANKPDSRHIDMRIHFCREHVELGDVATTFTPTPDMVSDFMTKQHNGRSSSCSSK
jgi:hypothetical protein